MSAEQPEDITVPLTPALSPSDGEREKPEQTGNSQADQQPTTAATPPAGSKDDEAALVKLYSEITGENESEARNTVSFIVGDKEDSTNKPPI